MRAKLNIESAIRHLELAAELVGNECEKSCPGWLKSEECVCGFKHIKEGISELKQIGDLADEESGFVARKLKENQARIVILQEEVERLKFHTHMLPLKEHFSLPPTLPEPKKSVLIPETARRAGEE